MGGCTMPNLAALSSSARSLNHSCLLGPAKQQALYPTQANQTHGCRLCMASAQGPGLSPMSC